MCSSLRSVFTLFVPVLFAAACQEGEVTIEPTDAYERAVEDLERTSQTVLRPRNLGGCGDIFVYAFDDADTRAVSFQIDDDLVADASSSYSTVTASYTLPHPAVTIEARWGQNMTYVFCNDVLEPGMMPVIDGTAVPISGTLHITVDPQITEDAYFEQGFATIELENVTFEHAATGAQKTIGSAILEDVFVGWLPG